MARVGGSPRAQQPDPALSAVLGILDAQRRSSAITKANPGLAGRIRFNASRGMSRARLEEIYGAEQVLAALSVAG